LGTGATLYAPLRVHHIGMPGRSPDWNVVMRVAYIIEALFAKVSYKGIWLSTNG